MKYIKFESGRGVYHLSLHKAYEYPYKLKYELYGATDKFMPVTYCNGNYIHVGDGELSKTPFEGRLCNACKQRFIRKFGEEALFTELL